jgi:hypothetical protein
MKLFEIRLNRLPKDRVLLYPDATAAPVEKQSFESLTALPAC